MDSLASPSRRTRPSWAWRITVAVIGFAVVPSAAVAGPTWDGGGVADATWTTASNWDSNVAPDLANGTSAIVFQTLGGGTAAAATQLGGGTVDILSLRALNFTGATVALGTTGQTVTGFSINSGTLIVRSGSISKANDATPVVVVNSALQLVSDGRFNNEFFNEGNAGIVFVGPISEDGTSRNVVVRGNTTAGGDTFSRVALGGVNTYTGSTTVERGRLLVGLLSSSTAANAGISAAPGVAGALGNSTSDVVVGNATTAANNWSVALEIGNGVNMSRGIRFANTGTGVARFETSAVGLRSSTLTLDRTISWHAFGGTQSWTGLVTGTGGFTKTGENLRLTNTANDFTGSVSLLQTGLSFDVSGTNNALGRGTSDIQITAAGANTTNGRTLTAIGSGTVSRGINVQATATQPVNITTTGTVEFSGNIVLNSLGGNVGLDAGGTQRSRFTGVISGSAPVITSGNASSNGSQVVLTNPNSSFSGQVRVGNGGLFIGGNVTAGQNGPLGNSSSSIWVGSVTSGANPSYLVTDGGYTVTRNLLVPGPSDGGSDSYTGAVLIGNPTNTSAIFSGSLAINRTPGSTRQNVLFASNDGSVEFSGPISGSAAIGIGGNVTNALAGVPDGRIGSVVLSGNNSGFSGDIAIQTRARLVVASNNALGTGTTPVAFYSFGSNTSGTYVGGVSTRGAVTVSRDLLLNGTNSTISQPVSFLGTSADASVFTGRITINRGVSQGVPEQSFGAVAGGSVDFQGVITGTGVIAVPIVKTGEGLVIFSATNTYRGTTSINAGVLRGIDGVGISGSNVILAGGVWESGTSITRGLGTGANQVQLTNANSGSSGFSSANAAGMTVAIGGTATPTALTFGAANFTMNTLALNATTATGPLAFVNPLNTGTGARGIFVGANTATVSGSISGTSGEPFTKSGAGTLVLSASNSFNNPFVIAGGTLRLTNSLALQNSPLDTSGAGRVELTVTAPTFGGLAGPTDLATEISSGYGGVTGLTLNVASGTTHTYTGAIADGAAGMTVTKTGSGTQILAGANSYTGQTTVSAGELHLGVGPGLSGPIANAASLVLLQGGPAPSVVTSVISGTGRVAVGGGTVVLSNAAQSFPGPVAVDAGIAEVALLNSQGLNSPLGTSGTIALGSGTTLGTLRYVGSGNSTNRVIYLAGSAGGGGVLDASGSGTVSFLGGVTAASTGMTLTLTGSNTGANFIQAITGSNVVKTGPGTWVFGENSFAGQLRVQQGTIVAAVNAPGDSGTSSSLGKQNGPIPVIGLANTTGTAALLAANGVTIARIIEVAALGSGDQEVVLGGSGAGEATFDANSAFRLGRGVTLAADPGGNVRFLTSTANWQQQNGSADPAVAVTIGTPTATGTVTLETRLPGSITAVSVRQGTLRLAVSSTFTGATPVTVGSAADSATLDLAGLGQTVQSLSFGGTAGLVVPGGGGGVLRLGGASPTVTAASGAGHRIDAPIALDEAATFTVAGAAARVTVAGGVADGANGARGLTKQGLGTLEVTGSSSYTGVTAVEAGTLELDGVLGDTALTVAVGATLTGTGTIGGPTTILGTHSPGSSPGIETFTNGLSYGASATLVWELIANSDSQRGILFDGVDLTGGALSVASGATLSLVFNLPGSTVDWDDAFWGTNRVWTIIDVAGGSWNSSLFTTLQVGVDSTSASLASKRPDSSFQIVDLSGDLVLEYVVVPEPGTLALAGLGLAVAAWGYRRRRNAQRRLW
jgi:fibronectin-binding autotransporter adhesin